MMNWSSLKPSINDVENKAQSVVQCRLADIILIMRLKIGALSLSLIIREETAELPDIKMNVR